MQRLSVERSTTRVLQWLIIVLNFLNLSSTLIIVLNHRDKINDCRSRGNVPMTYLNQGWGRALVHRGLDHEGSMGRGAGTVRDVLCWETPGGSHAEAQCYWEEKASCRKVGALEKKCPYWRQQLAVNKQACKAERGQRSATKEAKWEAWGEIDSRVLSEGTCLMCCVASQES